MLKNISQKVAKYNEQKVYNHTVQSMYKCKERSVSKYTKQKWKSTGQIKLVNIPGVIYQIYCILFISFSSEEKENFLNKM